MLCITLVVTPGFQTMAQTRVIIRDTNTIRVATLTASLLILFPLQLKREILKYIDEGHLSVSVVVTII